MLMRVAHTRLQTVDSYNTVRADIAGRVAALPSLGKVFGFAALAGGWFVASRTCLHLARGGRAVSGAVNPWVSLAVQSVSMLVLPLFRMWFLESDNPFRMLKMPTFRMPKMPTVPTPSEMFFRWLGLEK